MIHFFCALPCEARPLITHYRLQQLHQYDLFRIYQSKSKDISLTLTGIGKVNAAAAISYLHASLLCKPWDVWLNIGVAGHSDQEIGAAFLVNKITDLQTHESWYPQIIFDAPCQSMPLLTLEQPSDDYQHSLFDMEAAGFFQMATRLGTAELIHCFKLVSDNSANNTATVKAKDVSRLIEQRIPLLEEIVSELNLISKELEQSLSPPVGFEQFLQNWHFTQTQRIQLARLLHQWQCRLPDAIAFDCFKQQSTARAVLLAMRQRLEETAFVINTDSGQTT